MVKFVFFFKRDGGGRICWFRELIIFIWFEGRGFGSEFSGFLVLFVWFVVAFFFCF